MKVSEARKIIGAKVNAGLISSEQAARAQREISKLGTGRDFTGNRISSAQQSKLLAIWSGV